MTNFNISVSVTDAFMDALKNEGEYELVNPRSAIVVGKIKAHDVFKEIVESAWETGDPGSYSLTGSTGKIRLQTWAP